MVKIDSASFEIQVLGQNGPPGNARPLPVEVLLGIEIENVGSTLKMLQLTGVPVHRLKMNPEPVAALSPTALVINDDTSTVYYTDLKQ